MFPGLPLIASGGGGGVLVRLRAGLEVSIYRRTVAFEGFIAS